MAKYTHMDQGVPGHVGEETNDQTYALIAQGPRGAEEHMWMTVRLVDVHHTLIQYFHNLPYGHTTIM